MPILNVVPPDKAEGKVAKNYSFFDQWGIAPPAPFQMFSSSPGLQSIRLKFIEYNRDHPTLSQGLMAFIRMMVAEEMAYHYCVSFNRFVLKALGIGDDDQLAKVMTDPSQVPLSDKEKAMLLFVLKAVKTPEAVQAEDMAALRDLGWSDGDIFDATAHGTGMVSDGILFKAFKMDETC